MDKTYVVDNVNIIPIQSPNSSLWKSAKRIALYNLFFCYIVLCLLFVVFLVGYNEYSECEKQEYENNNRTSLECFNLLKTKNEFIIIIFWFQNMLWLILLPVMIYVNHKLRSKEKSNIIVILRWLQVYRIFLVFYGVFTVLYDLVLLLLYGGGITSFIVALNIFGLTAMEFHVIRKFYNQEVSIASNRSRMQSHYAN